MKSKIAIVLIIFLFVAACSTTQGSKSVNATASITIDTPATTDCVDLRVLCAVGVRQVMLNLVPEFQQATGHRVAITFNSSGEILKWVDSGKPVDIVIIYRSAVEQLAASERVIVGSLTNIATSRVGVAVAKGAPKPDISSPEAFRKTMLNAKTIACPDPAKGGASGTYIVRLFEQLGIAEALNSKLVLSSTPENESNARLPSYYRKSGDRPAPNAGTVSCSGH
jgi:molybdate transport system substrate-binding protein